MAVLTTDAPISGQYTVFATRSVTIKKVSQFLDLFESVAMRRYQSKKRVCGDVHSRLARRGASTGEAAATWSRRLCRTALAIFLRIGIPGLQRGGSGADMLKQHESLRKLLELDQTGFCATPGWDRLARAVAGGVGTGAALSGGDLCSVAMPSGRNRLPVGGICWPRMRHHPHEVFACLFLDNKNRVIQYEELFSAPSTVPPYHPRQVVKRAFRHNAAAGDLGTVIHPGSPSPAMPTK